jgi:hypothetical protein
MEYTGITFGAGALVSMLAGSAGALGVWFKLKGAVNIQKIEILNLMDEVKEIKVNHKEDIAALHKRTDSQKELIEKNRENSDTGLQSVTANINAMELRIIKAIHEIKS